MRGAGERAHFLWNADVEPYLSDLRESQERRTSGE
jgi:hypothetical protein